jgi:hypothetical protein
MSRQLSFYSALARGPGVADLAGMLCAGGEIVPFGSGEAARVSIAVDEFWRVRALAGDCAQRGVEMGLDADGLVTPVLRSAFRADLAWLAACWLNGTGKVVPEGLYPDGGLLRLWVIAAGSWSGTGYQLGLDPLAPHTHEALGVVLDRGGLAASQVGERNGGPALRIAGRRRIARLAELVGDPPGVGGVAQWPE